MADEDLRAKSDLQGRPICLCGERMDLARLEPHPALANAEIRVYECRNCGHSLPRLMYFPRAIIP